MQHRYGREDLLAPSATRVAATRRSAGLSLLHRQTPVPYRHHAPYGVGTGARRGFPIFKENLKFFFLILDFILTFLQRSNLEIRFLKENKMHQKLISKNSINL